MADDVRRAKSHHPVNTASLHTRGAPSSPNIFQALPQFSSSPGSSTAPGSNQALLGRGPLLTRRGTLLYSGQGNTRWIPSARAWFGSSKGDRHGYPVGSLKPALLWRFCPPSAGAHQSCAGRVFRPQTRGRNWGCAQRAVTNRGPGARAATTTAGERRSNAATGLGGAESIRLSSHCWRFCSAPRSALCIGRSRALQPFVLI